MIFDLHYVTETFLKSCTYKELLNVFDLMENRSYDSISSIEMVEEYETYLSFCRIIIKRLKTKDSFDRNDKPEQNEVKELLERVSRFEKTISDFLFLCTIINSNYFKNLNDTSELSKAVQKNEAILSKFINKSQDSINDVISRFSNSEHEILTHVLTLMGIFVGLITIIMSVVITSTSWLNNSSSASAIIAFIVPNAVVILSIAVLFLFIFLYRKDIPYISAIQYSEKDMPKSTDVKEGQETDRAANDGEIQNTQNDPKRIRKKEKNIQKQENRKRVAIMISVIIIVAASITVLTYSALKYIMPSENSHQRYIIKQSQYSVTDGYDYEANCKRQYFEFNNEGKNHQFAFNEKFIHDGNLYYCDDHNRLE